MTLTEKQLQEIVTALNKIDPLQLERVKSLLSAFDKPVTTTVNSSRCITQKVVDELSVRLVAHHASTSQAMTKTIFEHAFNDSLNAAQIPSALCVNATNRGHDITIAGVPASLKSEAARNIRQGMIHISKFMELGRGAWNLPDLLQQFLTHLNGYDEIYTLRCISREPFAYELVEIPKTLLLMAENANLVVQTESKQSPQPGYGHVQDSQGNPLFSLYFDGGAERKLQIKNLDKRYCIVRATWEF